MIKTIKKQKQVIEETVIDVICNKCGKTCSNHKRKNLKQWTNEYSGLIETEVDGGYDSEIIGDMVSWKFSICEHCLSDIVENFKIPPMIKDQSISSEFLTQSNHNKLYKKALKKSKEDYIKEILKINKNFSKSQLKKMSLDDLFHIFHNRS